MVHDLVPSLLVLPGIRGGQPHSCVSKMFEFFQGVILLYQTSQIQTFKFTSLCGNRTLQFKKAIKEMLFLPSNFICSGIFPETVVKS